MVSRPSNCHIVTLGTLWNMQEVVHIGHNDKPETTFSTTLWLGVYVIKLSAPMMPHRPPIQPGIHPALY